MVMGIRNQLRQRMNKVCTDTSDLIRYPADLSSSRNDETPIRYDKYLPET